MKGTWLIKLTSKLGSECTFRVDSDLFLDGSGRHHSGKLRMFALYACLFLASMALTGVVYYRWCAVLSLLREQHPALHRKITYPAPMRGGLWSIFRLCELLDDDVSPQDQLFIRRTQSLVMLATLVGLAMLAVVAFGAMR
jgi:hypothetical protein